MAMEKKRVPDVRTLLIPDSPGTPEQTHAQLSANLTLLSQRYRLPVRVVAHG